MKKRKGEVKKEKMKAKKGEDEGGEKKAIMGILLLFRNKHNLELYKYLSDKQGNQEVRTWKLEKSRIER